MFMNRSQQRGFTLIELIIFIVAVSVGLAGILLVMDTVVKSSADPLVRKQVVVLAESILEEVLQKKYADPDGVDDYHDKTQALFTDWPAGLSGYQVAIKVDPPADLGGTSTVLAKKVTVKVTGGGHEISLSGYRANY